MTHFPELLILRHGQTEWNKISRLQGNLDSPLTDLGRAQAQAQHRILADFDTAGFDWVSSPMGRAKTTAEIAGQGLAPLIRTDARLREIEIGDWTGLTKTQILGQRPDLFTQGEFDWYNHAPGGEGIDGLAKRVHSFLGDVTTKTVVITHGITSRVMRCLLMNRPVTEFDKVGGGQGVVYNLKNSESRLLR